jgi:DNA-directed RNA polymerase subunit omega
MARITIEDCRKEIPNRFELVLLASQKARGISTGDKVTIKRGESVSVLALKEIASSNLDIDKLRDSFITSQQATNIDNEDIEIKDTNIELIGNDLMQNEELYNANYDLSDLSLDNNFSDILLEKE